MSADPRATRVAERFAYKFKPKESKESKVDRVGRLIRDRTGLGKGVSEAIADALVRSSRDIERLALQKKWPIEDGSVVGESGSVTIQELRDSI